MRRGGVGHKRLLLCCQCNSDIRLITLETVKPGRTSSAGDKGCADSLVRAQCEGVASGIKDCSSVANATLTYEEACYAGCTEEEHPRLCPNRVLHPGSWFADAKPAGDYKVQMDAGKCSDDN
eukprot:GHVS01024146.1.p1 GENE.GHVS01024146.1~~GHVS01024146.1.p1  ORF type:complete len:122 (+),score=2.27 GHVS01024146.1:664-1029(+)